MLPLLTSVDVAHKRVLVRTDFNVPLQDGHITDTSRIERVLPTLNYLRKHQAKIIIMTHIGRPKGQRSAVTSTQQLQQPLQQFLNCSVNFVSDYQGEAVQQAVTELAPGQILLLENVRYDLGEETNDQTLAQSLSTLADIYINDAFSVSHRAHASVAAITSYLPSYAGLLFQEEVQALQTALDRPTHPLIAIVGGAKISTKLEILTNLVHKVDKILLGGGIANTFLKAQGYDIGSSLHEPTMVDVAKSIMEKSQQSRCEIIVPVDAVVVQDLYAHAPHEIVDISTIKPMDKIVDIGPKTVALLQQKIKLAKTIVWNGPFGVFEIPPFDQGTRSVIQTVVEQTRQQQLYSVAGGGETVAAIVQSGGEKGFSYLSTAGGAFLEWLEGKSLPGIVALQHSSTRFREQKTNETSKNE